MKVPEEPKEQPKELPEEPKEDLRNPSPRLKELEGNRIRATTVHRCFLDPSSVLNLFSRLVNLASKDFD